MIEVIISKIRGKKVTEEEVDKILPDLKDVYIEVKGLAINSSKKHLDSISKKDIMIYTFENVPPFYEEEKSYRVKQKNENVEIKINQKGHYPFYKKDGSSYNVPYKVNILIKGKKQNITEQFLEQIGEYFKKKD